MSKTKDYKIGYCPIRDDDCIGKECMMCIKVDHPLHHPFHIIYKCGLVTISAGYDHGDSQDIDHELREDLD